MTTAAQPESDHPPSWSELLGSRDWEGLLDPLNLSLRHLIIRCGDFCQATYDAFNNDGNSKYAGSSRYGKKSFFNKVMLQSANDYQIHCFLYATAQVSIAKAIFLRSSSRDGWDRESNWIGYIATTTDDVSRAIGRREIYVVWRGTSRDYEWINVSEFRPQSADQLLRRENRDEKNQIDNEEENGVDNADDKIPKVMDGWLKIYTSNDPNSPFTKLSARDQLHAKIKSATEQYKDENVTVTFTGHSLGACLATLSAFDIVENGVIGNIPVSAFVFGSPQVGNRSFRDRVRSFPNLKILHVRNKIDLITHYPSVLLGYRDVGVDLVIDHRKSPNLKVSFDTGDWHNLQAMLHVVAGWNGDDGEFEMKMERSLALVNKSCAFLKDEYLIPGSWWAEKNKGMVLKENGEWLLAPPSDEDLPQPEDF